MGAAEKLIVTRRGDAEIVVVGQIDAHTSPTLEDALISMEDGADVAVDLSDVSFVDSSGLRVIVRAHNRQSDGGGRLTLVDPSEAVRRLLDITGLTSQLQIRS